MITDIHISLNNAIGLYTVTFNDNQGREGTLECLSAAEVAALSVGEMLRLLNACE